MYYNLLLNSKFIDCCKFINIEGIWIIIYLFYFFLNGIWPWVVSPVVLKFRNFRFLSLLIFSQFLLWVFPFCLFKLLFCFFDFFFINIIKPISFLFWLLNFHHPVIPAFVILFLLFWCNFICSCFSFIVIWKVKVTFKLTYCCICFLFILIPISLDKFIPLKVILFLLFITKSLP